MLPPLPVSSYIHPSPLIGRKLLSTYGPPYRLLFLIAWHPQQTWSQFKDAEPIPAAVLLHPSMPSDPSFLDLPVKDLFQRYLIIHPSLQLAHVIIGSIFIKNYWDWDVLTIYELVDFILSIFFSLFGYIAFYRMIPEWITVLGYFLLLRFTAAFGVKVYVLYSVVVGIQVDAEVILIVFIVLIVLGVIGLSMVANFIAFRIVFRIEKWARECRRIWKRGVYSPGDESVEVQARQSDTVRGEYEDEHPLILCT
ncbi:hypothetical protein BCR33DRAFT_711586 [Rhizoclosmatium globosum]|uniref:Uncharacterized protein n=1 Tax=Rhizoclosmatium globosum TaxID=329046 RepID=A0A1Y2D224_9FUNG|nr:hypothetical protein BCR33DRAFT_711586 [Rhizoclosmatium globosum]|eukprot:ORY53257.1 hypothetical protein BCR33DRAFT_711586 [Rhizoclosmatium globosum]